MTDSRVGFVLRSSRAMQCAPSSRPETVQKELLLVFICVRRLRRCYESNVHGYHALNTIDPEPHLNVQRLCVECELRS